MAKRGFAVHSGLVDERQFFTPAELAAMYVNAIKVRIMPDNDLGSKETEALDSVIEKIENIMPELGTYYADPEAEHDAELSEGVEP
jgi:regulator of RNase E activity RraB